MSSSNADFLRMIAYFWQEKADLERYCFFDIERLRRLSPDTARAWEDYKRADRQMDRMAEECGEMAYAEDFEEDKKKD